MKDREYDLEEKLEVFGEAIIDLVKKTPKNILTAPILDQLIKSGTSMGANYMEANGASSRQDFRNKIYICKKESKETMHWLRMLARACDLVKDDCRKSWTETQGYAKMFSKIGSSLKSKK